MALLRPETINFIARITEDEIKKRLADEVLQSIGGLGDDGKPLPGVSAKVRRGLSRVGGYTVEVSGPMPARMVMLPGPE